MRTMEASNDAYVRPAESRYTPPEYGSAVVYRSMREIFMSSSSSWADRWTSSGSQIHGGRDEHQLPGVPLRQEGLLRGGDLPQGVRARDDRPDLAAFHVLDQVLEDLVLLERAAKEREVLEVDRSQVDLRDRSSDGARDGVSTTWPQQVQQLREPGTADEVDHHVDGCPAEGVDEVCAAVDGPIGTLGQHVGGLRGRAHRGGRRAAALGELHRGESHASGGAGHEHPLRLHRGSVQHVLRRGVGAGHSREFLVAPVAAHGVRLPSGSDRELREPTVALAAEGPALERPVV